jgi:hypothetical protein
MKKGDAAKASPRTIVGRREEDATHPPGSEEGLTSSGSIRRTERTTAFLLLDRTGLDPVTDSGPEWRPRIASTH